MGMSNSDQSNIVGKLGASIRARGLWATLTLIPKNIMFLLTDFDLRYGTDTGMGNTGQIDTLPADHEGYEGTRPRLFHRIINSLNVDCREFVFLDLGSGKGRALLLASHYPFKRVIGVEYESRLHEIAGMNARIYCHSQQKTQQIETVCGDAAAFSLPTEPLIIYMYNPFKASILSQVLDNIKASLEQPRQILIIYQNPLHRNLLDTANFLELKNYHHYRDQLFRKRPTGRVAIYQSIVTGCAG